jgi:hypothetical protein
MSPQDGHLIRRKKATMTTLAICDTDTPRNCTMELEQQVHDLFAPLFHTYGLHIFQCCHKYLNDHKQGNGPGIAKIREALSGSQPPEGFIFTFSAYGENSEFYGLPSVTVMREGSDIIRMKVFAVPDDYYPDDPIRHEVFFADVSEDEKQALIQALGAYLECSKSIAKAQLQVLNDLSSEATAA